MYFYFWNWNIFDFARDQRASSFPVDLFLNTKDCFVICEILMEPEENDSFDKNKVFVILHMCHSFEVWIPILNKTTLYNRIVEINFSAYSTNKYGNEKLRKNYFWI